MRCRGGVRCGPEVQTLKEQDWEHAQQAIMLADMAQAFESDEGMSDGEGDRVPSSAQPLSCRPAGRPMPRLRV